MPVATIRLGFFTADEPDPRSVTVTQAAFAAFCNQLRTVLANPAPVKALVRARVSAMVGPQFDGETDDWVYQVCTAGQIIHGIPNADEMSILHEELIS